MKRKLLAAGAALALILAALPWSAALLFPENGEEERRILFSSFDPAPFGYGNPWPLLTAVAVCALLVCALTVWIKKTGCALLQVLSGAAFVLSVMPVFSGWRYLTVTGVLLSLVLLAETVLSFLTLPEKEAPAPEKRKKKRRKK
ncbi:MAG: hypothetical protein II776_04885 [Clostridia bacterium]|nr:hypothetical protein [Clostridia bacterium]